jgi:excisionase family DNA binding protein
MSNAERTSVEPILLTASHVAKLLQISPRTLWRLVSAGGIVEPVRLGRSVRWRKDELARWIADGCPVQTRKS